MVKPPKPKKQTKKKARKVTAAYIARLTKARDAAALKLAKHITKLTDLCIQFYRLEDGPLIAFENAQRALDAAKTHK